MNNENNNNQDLIHVGNDLNNQEINEQPSSEQQNQTPMYNRSSASMMKDGLHKGMNKIKERKNNAALGQSGINGQKNPMKGQKKPNNLLPKKSDSNKGKNKSDKDNKNKNAQNKNDNQNKRNPLPGGTNKKDENRNKAQNKQNDDNKNQNNATKKPNGSNNGNFLKNKFGGGEKKSKQGSKGASAAGEAAKKAAKKGIKAIWTVLPIQAKVIVAIAVPVLLIIMFIILALLGGTTAAITTASICGSAEYDVNGTDATEFLCSMTSPFGDKKYTVTGTSGWRYHPIKHRNKFHYGTDVVVQGSDLSIYAVQAGTIEEIGSNSGWGNTILINHGNFTTRYAHLSKFESGLKKGDKVTQGQKIGTEGSTGDSTGPHLHFELKDSKNNYLSANPFFGYSDQGYEACIQDSKVPDMSKCDFDNNKSARSLGEEGFAQICGKTGEYNSENNCCTNYSSSASSENVEGLPKIITQEFVNGAIKTQSKYGVPASLTLAQIVIESGGDYPGNLSGLAYNCKNLFGIKGKGTSGSCNYSTGEQTSGGSHYTIKANFRKYNNFSEGIEDHGKLLAGDYYKKCTTGAKTADDWAKAIKKCGYATDVNYAEKLTGIMKKYNLYQYDDSSAFGTGATCETTSHSTGSGDIVKRANEEYEKWNKSSPSERTEMIKSYMSACGNGKTCNHWCAGFVSFILKETGKLDKLKGYSCMAKSYKTVSPAEHHKQGSGYTPKAGDVVYFEWKRGGQHVAIVESVEGKTLHYIGGNQKGKNTSTCWGNAVTKNTINLNDSQIVNYATIG